MQHRVAAQRPQTQSRLPVVRPGIQIEDAGLLWGLDSVLVRMRKAGERHELALEEDRKRLLAMLWVAGYRPADQSAVFRHLDAVSAFWRSGQKALANFRLVFAGLPRFCDPADAYRVALAEHLLDRGSCPRDLLADLGFEAEAAAFEKYSPDQPRVPAGSGVESGRWQFWPEAHQEGRSRSRPIRVAEADELEDKLRSQERQLLNETTPQEQLDESHGIQPPRAGGAATGLPQTIGVGPYAGPPVLAGPGPKPLKDQQNKVNYYGQKYGCHTCGTKDPGTSTNNFVCDHQNPTALVQPGDKQYYYPQCLQCSRRQGGYVTSYKRKNGG